MRHGLTSMHQDLYQIHRYDPAVDLDETLGALTDLVRAGKVRYIGHSTFPPSAIVDAQWTSRDRGRERFVTEQPSYSTTGTRLNRVQLDRRDGGTERS
ncbi:MAG: aldo/keto reductase [Mycobacterium sp.]|nr:aldo/keto reductase [Mycobacterium sp.]